jgi:hypothetical protein
MSVLLLVSGATRDVVWTDRTRVGVLFSPANRNTDRAIDGRVWGVDNGAFNSFDANQFIKMLERLRGVPGCRFVTAPDVVGDAVATLKLFETWEPIVRALGYPVALVAQNGLRVSDVPWPRIDALFIGGTPECRRCAYVRPVREFTRTRCPHCSGKLSDWKLSREVDELLAYAAARGKWRHVGRVNSRLRMRHFWGLADSCDGSGFSRWPKRARQADRWLQEIRQKPRLTMEAIR